MAMNFSISCPEAYAKPEKKYVRTTKGKETRLSNKIKKYLESLYIYVEKIWGGGFQSSGVPDLLFCYKGIFVGMELKVDNKKPSELQKAKLLKINKSGGVGVVVYSFDECLKTLEFIDSFIRMGQKMTMVAECLEGFTGVPQYYPDYYPNVNPKHWSIKEK